MHTYFSFFPKHAADSLQLYTATGVIEQTCEKLFIMFYCMSNSSVFPNKSTALT